MCFFFSGHSKHFLFITCDYENVIMVCLSVICLYSFPAWASCCFLDLVFIKFRKKNHYSCRYFACPPPPPLLGLQEHKCHYLTLPNSSSHGDVLLEFPHQEKTGHSTVRNTIRRQPSAVSAFRIYLVFWASMLFLDSLHSGHFCPTGNSNGKSLT